MSRQEEIGVEGGRNPRTLEEIAKYVAEKLKEELAKERHFSDVKYSVFKDNIEIVAGAYFGNIEYEAGDEEDYDNLLEQINDENMNEVRGKITTEKFTVYFMPQNCQGESCIAGIRVVIKIKKGLDDVLYWDLDNVVNLIKAVYLL
jgi:hypothetical protein